MTTFSHSVTQHVLAPAKAAFDFLADPIRLGRWSLGCFETEATETAGLFTGLSLFDGARGYYRIATDPSQLAIDYHVGSRKELAHRISARVMDGAPLGYPENTCLATLIAWRAATMPEERWKRLCAAHEAEIWLIKGQIETAVATGA